MDKQAFQRQKTAAKGGYGQFCPVAMGAEIFATRWTPLLLRELMCGSSRFSDLQKGLPLMSRALLSRRLKDLVEFGILRREAVEGAANATYHLTEAGEALRPVVMGLGEWAHEWLRKPVPEDNLDPTLLMWDIRRNLDPDSFAGRERLVIEFQLTGGQTGSRRFWLVIAGAEVDLCYKAPGGETDIQVSVPVRTLTDIWLGRLGFDQALEAGSLRLEAGPTLARAFRASLRLSPFARPHTL